LALNQAPWIPQLLPVFVKLLEALESGHCHFEKLTQKEVEHLDEVHLAELAASGEVMPV
jgi:hypothetical protein